MAELTFSPEELTARKRLRHDPRPLSYEMLADIFPKYKQSQFSTVDRCSSLVLINRSKIPEGLPHGKKVFVNFMGPSAAGKDSILKKAVKMVQNLKRDIKFSKVVTATTREPDTEIRKEDSGSYEYMNNESFIKAKENVRFIETVHQDPYYYGTPKDAVDAAISSGDIITWIGEIGGSDDVLDYVREHYPNVVTLSVFVLPTQLTFREFAGNLLKQRKNNPVQRVRRVIKEFASAHKVDILLLNPFDQSGEPIQAPEALTQLLTQIIS